MTDPVNGSHSHSIPSGAYIPESCDCADSTPEGIREFVETDLSVDVDRLTEHSAELNWLVSNLGPAMSPEQRDAAIRQFMESQQAGWEGDLNTLQDAVARDGAEVLERLAQTEGLSQAERQQILDDLLSDDNPQAQVAILLALSRPDLVDTQTLDDAIGFFDAVGIVSAAPDFAGQIAQARLQRVHDVAKLVDPSDPASIQAARDAIAEFRASGTAHLLGIPDAQFGAWVDTLDRTLPQPGVTLTDAENDARIADQRRALDSIDNATGDATLSQGLRLLGASFGLIGAVGAGQAFLDDMNLETGTRAVFEAMGVSNEVIDLYSNAVRSVPENSIVKFVGSEGLGKALGAVGVIFSGIDMARFIRDGDGQQAALAGASMVGGLLALSSTAAIAGVGIVIGVIAAAGAIGLNQWRKVDASNEFMNDTSRDFLVNAGLSLDAAGALVDQSGNGHSPVPFLFAYGDSLGMSREETIVWLNSLDAGDLESIRDRAHEILDETGGDFSDFGNSTDEGVISYLAEFRQAGADGAYTAHDGNVFWIGDQSHIVTAGSWDEYTAVLAAKGLPVPAPALANNGAPVTIESATTTLIDNFDAISGNGDDITRDDLVRVRDDESLDMEMRLAAEFLVNSKAARSFLDVGRGRGEVDGYINREDLLGAQDAIESGAHLEYMVDTARGRGGRDGNVSTEDYSAAYFDPGIPLEYRLTLEKLAEG